jgi:WD40 repeat protein
MRRAGAVALALALSTTLGCSGPGKNTTQPPPVDVDPCTEADALLTQAGSLQNEGYLGRALAHVEHALELCPSDRARAAEAEGRRELWIDGSVVNTRDASEEERANARLLYRAGAVLRDHGKKYDDSLARLRESYALWPHPLTIVQMGLTHRAAGRDIDYRKANARAYAVAGEARDGEPTARIHRGHTGQVASIALHPTRPIAATGGEEGTIILWDLSSGRIQRRLEGKGYIWTLVFAPEGDHLVALSDEDGVRVWDIETGVVTRELDAGSADIWSIRFTPDGTRLIGHAGNEQVLWDWKSAQRTSFEAQTSSDDATHVARVTNDQIHVIDVESRAELRAVAMGSTVTAVSLSPDGRLLAAADDRESVAVFDTKTGQRHNLDAFRMRSISDLQFGPRGTYLVGSTDAMANKKGEKHHVEVWNVDTGVRIANVGQEGKQMDFLFAQDGMQVGWTTDRASVVLVDLDNGESTVMTVGTGGTATFALSADGRTLAVAHGPTTLWDIELVEEVRVLATNSTQIQSLAVSSDGTHIASASWDSTVMLWSLGSNTTVRPLDGHVWTDAVDFSPDGRILASSGQHVKVWDVSTGENIWSTARARESIPMLAFSPDGTTLVWAAYNYLESWAVGTDEEERTLGNHRDYITSMAFHPEGTILVTAGADGALRFWNPSKSVETRSIDGHASYALAFNPDGTVLASESSDGIALRDAATGRVQSTLESNAPITSLAYDVSGTILASASGRTITVWDLASGSAAHTLAGHTQLVTDIAFGPSGILVSSGRDNTLRLWDTTKGAQLATLFATGLGTWVVTTPDGRVDGSPGERGGASLIYWQVGDVQLPGFVGWQRYHTPGLLAEIMNAE